MTKPFKCSRCAWLEPHGHRGKLSISLSSLVSRGEFLKAVVGRKGSEYIELITQEELIERVKQMGPGVLEQLHEAMSDAIGGSDAVPTDGVYK